MSAWRGREANGAAGRPLRLMEIGLAAIARVSRCGDERTARKARERLKRYGEELELLALWPRARAAPMPILLAVTART